MIRSSPVWELESHAWGLFQCAFYLSRPASGPLSGRSGHELPGKTGRIGRAIDAGTVLMHADNRRVDHLYRRVMGASQRVHNPAPDASPAPANEAIVASGVGTKTVR